MAHTKTDIVDDVVVKTGLERETTSDGVETLIEIIKSNLSKSEDVSLSGFGKVHVIEKRTRRGRNPKTGEEITITPKTCNYLSLSNILRAQLDGSKE
jgi:integration host factor subunit alpha